MNTLTLAVAIEMSVFAFAMLLVIFAWKNEKKVVATQHPNKKIVADFLKKVGTGLVIGHVVCVNLMLLREHEVPLRFALELISGVLMGMLLIVCGLVIKYFTEEKNEWV